MFRSLIPLFFTMCTFSPVSALETLGVGDWLTSFDDETCWISAHVYSLPSEDEERYYHKDIYFNVAFHNGSPQPEFSIFTDDIDKYNEEVMVSLGSETYEFTVLIGAAFSRSRNDRDILFKMLKGNSPSFTLKVGSTETLPVLLVPLDGFKEAYNYISKKCSFENNPGFFRKLGSLRDYRSGHFI